MDPGISKFALANPAQVGALGLPETWFSRTFPFLTKPFQFHNTGLNTSESAKIVHLPVVAH